MNLRILMFPLLHAYINGTRRSNTYDFLRTKISRRFHTKNNVPPNHLVFPNSKQVCNNVEKRRYTHYETPLVSRLITGWWIQIYIVFANYRPLLHEVRPERKKKRKKKERCIQRRWWWTLLNDHRRISLLAGSSPFYKSSTRFGERSATTVSAALDERFAR